MSTPILFALNPEAAILPTTGGKPNKIQLSGSNSDRYALLYDYATEEEAVFSLPFPRPQDLSNLSNDATLRIKWSSLAPSGQKVVWLAAFAFVKAGQAVDAVFGSDFESAPVIHSGSGYENESIITLTNLLSGLDSSASYRILVRIKRKVSGVTDNLESDVQLFNSIMLGSFEPQLAFAIPAFVDGLDNGAVGDWRFDHSGYACQGSGGKTLTPSSAPTEVRDRLFVPKQKYLDVSPNIGFSLSLADSATYFPNDDFTFMLLANLVNVSAGTAFLAFRNASFSDYFYIESQGGSGRFYENGTFRFTASGVFLGDSRWHVYAVRRKTNVVSFWRDGVKIGGDSPVLPTPSGPVREMSLFSYGSDQLRNYVSQTLIFHEGKDDSEIEGLTQTLMGTW